MDPPRDVLDLDRSPSTDWERDVAGVPMDEISGVIGRSMWCPVLLPVGVYGGCGGGLGGADNESAAAKSIGVIFV